VGARATSYSPDATHPPTSPTAVRVFNTVPPFPFERIGEVEARGAPAASWDRVVDSLREEAAKIGGEGVIVGDRRQEFRMVDRNVGPLYEKRLVGVVIRFTGLSPQATTTTTVAPSPTTSATAVRGLSGTYHGRILGTASGRPLAGTITFTVVQSGNDLSGVWTTSFGHSGTVGGALSGTAIPIFRAVQMNPCQGGFVGMATVTEAPVSLRGRYVGQDCHGPLDAEFMVDRQP
jgi:hypothetical protein